MNFHVSPSPASPWPIRRCPGCRTALDLGPVVFYCCRCRKSVQAADLDGGA